MTMATVTLFFSRKGSWRRIAHVRQKCPRIGRRNDDKVRSRSVPRSFIGSYYRLCQVCSEVRHSGQ